MNLKKTKGISMNKTKLKTVGKFLLQLLLAPFKLFLLIISTPPMEHHRGNQEQTTRSYHPYETYRI